MIYMDNAATSYPKPDCVYDAVDDYMRNSGASIGRSHSAAADAAFGIVSQCRQQLALLMDAESASNVAFTFNCTDSLNLLLRGILKRGMQVVSTQLEHNSVLRPLNDLTESGVSHKLLEFDSQTGLIDCKDIERELRQSSVDLVVLSHASNVTGVVQPVKEVAALCRAHGALLLLDAAQTAGHLPFSVREMDVDFLAAAGHKGLLGPLGTGLLYVRPGLEERVAHVRSGGTGTVSESAQQPTQMPSRFESGNPNGPGLAGLAAAVTWMSDQTISQVHDLIQERLSQLCNGLTAIDSDRLHVFCSDSVSAGRNCGVLSFVLEGIDSREVAAILEQSFQIACRAGFHCAPLTHQRLGTIESGGTIRFSPGLFTTEQDINRAVEAVQQLCEFAE